jgi:hypothetical protein
MLRRANNSARSAVATSRSPISIFMYPTNINKFFNLHNLPCAAANPRRTMRDRSPAGRVLNSLVEQS